MATDTETVLSGHAARFYDAADKGTTFDMGGGVVERIAPGTFQRSLSENGDIFALIAHDPSRPIGRTTASPVSLTVREDSRGLAVRILPLATRDGLDALKLVESRTMRSMSFSFTTVRDSWSKADGKIIRTLEDVNLLEVSLVSWPAYTASSIFVENVTRGLTQTLGRMQNRANQIRNFNKPLSRTAKMILEKSDEQRGQHVPALMNQSLAQLRARRVALLQQLTANDAILDPYERAAADERVKRQLAEAERDERSLTDVMERRSR